VCVCIGSRNKGEIDVGEWVVARVGWLLTIVGPMWVTDLTCAGGAACSQQEVDDVFASAKAAQKVRVGVGT